MDGLLLFLATHAPKYSMKLELFQLFRASQQLKSKYDSSHSLWAPSLQFRSPSEITSLSSQSRGTGGYGFAPAVPLKPPFFLSAPTKCLIVSYRHDKKLRFFSRFLQFVLSAILFFLFFFLFLFKTAVPAFVRNNLVRIENLIFKNSRILRPSLSSIIRC